MGKLNELRFLRLLSRKSDRRQFWKRVLTPALQLNSWHKATSRCILSRVVLGIISWRVLGYNRSEMLLYAWAIAAPNFETLFEGPLGWVKRETLFVYLDAHWNDNLPLDEELDIVFQNCPTAVVIIEVQVADDPGYAYDDYGPGKALTLSYIAPTILKLGLRIFYPSTPSSEEGGARRGCVVLVKNGVHSQALDSSPLLQAAE